MKMSGDEIPACLIIGLSCAIEMMADLMFEWMVAMAVFPIKKSMMTVVKWALSTRRMRRWMALLSASFLSWLIEQSVSYTDGCLPRRLAVSCVASWNSSSVENTVAVGLDSNLVDLIIGPYTQIAVDMSTVQSWLVTSPIVVSNRLMAWLYSNNDFSLG